MQSSKAPKKTSKIADKPVVAVASEPSADTKSAAKPRAAARSSKKKMESVDAQPTVKHHHKLSNPVVSESVNVPAAESGKAFVASAAASSAAAAWPADSPTRVIHHADIANLAYSYWIERGYQSGSPEEDWLRAERELSGLR